MSSSAAQTDQAAGQECGGLMGADALLDLVAAVTSSELILPSISDLTAADSLHVRLCALLAQHENVAVNAGAAERLSTACLQILVAAALAARARGIGFVIRAPSSVFRAAVADLGLSTVLPMEIL